MDLLGVIGLAAALAAVCAAMYLRGKAWSRFAEEAAEKREEEKKAGGGFGASGKGKGAAGSENGGGNGNKEETL